MYTPIKKIVAILAFAASTSIASAEVSIEDYQKNKDSDYIKAYLAGVGIGASYSNAFSKRFNKIPLYCQPEKLSLGSANYIQIMETEIENESAFYKPDIPIEVALVAGLIKTFPCK